MKREDITEAAKLLIAIDGVAKNIEIITKDKGDMVNIVMYDEKRSKNFGSMNVPKGEAIKLIEASVKSAKARLKELGVKV